MTTAMRDISLILLLALATLAGCSQQPHQIVGAFKSSNRGSVRWRGLDLPAGATIELKPGGYHLMLVQPHRRFVEGEQVTMELAFERAGKVALRFPIKAIQATDGSTHSQH